MGCKNLPVDSDLVRYKNELNRASWRLSALEQRVILSAISKISTETAATDWLPVTVEDLVDIGTPRNHAYEVLKQAGEGLFLRYLTINYSEEGAPEDYRKIRWIQEIRVQQGSGTLQLRFTESLVPFLSGFKEQFTQYGRLELKGLDSQYAMRLYSLLMQFKQTGWFQIGLDDLKKRLDLADRFERYTDFRRFVLEIAKKQINNGECTTIKFSYEPIKTGRSVTALKFHIRLKTNRQPPDIEGEAIEHKPKTAKQLRYVADVLAGKATYNQNGKQFDAGAFLTMLYGLGIVEAGAFSGLEMKAASDKFMSLLTDSEFVKNVKPLLMHWGIYL